MDVDDPLTPEFASWNGYGRFSDLVRRSKRYVWDSKIQAFLETVLATSTKRVVNLKKGTILYRCQHGVDYRCDEDDLGEEPVGYEAERMKPLLHRASEGRANASGIPVLYLASSIITAASEVRPWIGAELSVAQFEIKRNLKVIDLAKGHGQSIALSWEELIGDKEPDAETKEESVWVELDDAFSRPVVRSDDTADYAPTQIIGELFKNSGYDGLYYRSQFGEKGYNIALFNINDAEILNCAPYLVSKIDLQVKETGSRWYRVKE